MKKILIFIIPCSFFLSFWVEGQDTIRDEPGLPLTDSISQKAGTGVVKTCLDCHGSLVEKKIKHTTETDKGCDDCHKGSGISHPPAKITLQNSMPDLCLSCHEETKTLLTGSPFVHGAVNEKKACINCHSPHSSDVKKLLVMGRKELCLSCHNKTITDKTETHTNMDKLMKTSKVFHPPFETCAKACHNPHASQDKRLLEFAYPTNNYLPANLDSFALCWECHASDMIETPKTEGATNFRNADTNLHYVHVQGEKGRSCALCHSPHATNNQHLIKEQIRFGKWDFRMNYISTETGGSCSPACHTEKKYTR